MSSKGGPQKEPKSEQPKPGEEQKEVANPGDPQKSDDKKGGDE